MTRHARAAAALLLAAALTVPLARASEAAAVTVNASALASVSATAAAIAAAAAAEAEAAAGAPAAAAQDPAPTAGVPAPAAAVAPGSGLDLARVVDATLASNPEIQIAAQAVEARRGALIAAGAPFDALLQASSRGARRQTLDPEGTATDITQSVSLRRLFRNGLLIAPDLSLVRAGHTTIAGPDTPNDLNAGLSFGVPLLRDRGGIVSAAPERAAERDFRASVLDLRQAMSLRVLTAVVAYWDYAAATRRLEVFIEAERRAARSAEETAALVKADERTTADHTQTLGNLAAKRVQRIAAEQGVVEAKQPLGLAMGLPLDQVIALPRPATELPALAAEDGARRTLSALLDEAYARRADFAASAESVSAAEILVEASKSELKPRLDLLLGTGYRTRELGLGVGRYFAPLGPVSRDLDVSAQLTYQFAPANSAARGRSRQAVAAYEQQRVARSDLQRRITTGVAVAASALQRGEAGMRESAEAVRLLESTVQAEERKFQFGVSTLFDVIQAQDALTSALLGRIESQRTYAVAIATVRFQSGLLLSEAAGRPALDAATLLTPP